MELNKNVPAIRFKGFSKEWQMEQLKEFSSYKSSNLSASNAYDKGAYKVYDANQCIGYTNRRLMKDDYITIIKDGSGVGRVRILKGNSSFIATMGAITNENSDLYFLYNILLKTDFNKHITGATIPHIYYSVYGNEEYHIPKEPEQTQIGNFFKTLDSQITSQEQKHQKLINLKKAMLEKMFPKEGADVPEIRFKGFTEKWEEKKLGDVVKIFNGYAFQSKNFVLFNSNIIVLTPGNVKVCGGYQAEKGHYYNPNSQYLSKFKFEVNDIFITLTDLTPTGQTLGYPAIVPNDGNIYLHNQRLGKLFDIKTDRLFLYHFLCTNLYHNNVVSTSSGTTVKHSSSEKIQLIKIFVPSLKEQQKIGEYFEKLDNLIQQSQEQIKKHKNIKQALLQKMFV